MQYAYLGRSGMKVSRLCLGTMNFGEYTDVKECFKIMDAALDAGINFFDTSNTYRSDDPSVPSSEEIIGMWFAQGNGRREKVILATKVYGNADKENDGPNGPGGLSAFKIRRHLEASLKRLKTDHIELYQMHHIDLNVSWDELWEVFESLVHQGKIYYVGSSNFAAWNLAVAQGEAKARHFMGLVSEQHRYNLICRLPELEVIPAAKALGLGILPWSPLASGILSRSALNPGANTRTEKRKDMIERRRDKLEKYSQLCREIGETEETVALAWLLANPAVTSPIIGPRTLEQFESSLRALEVKLTDDVLKKLDEIFPGPGGKAPEAYAW